MLIGTRPFDIDTDSTVTVIASVVGILLALSWVVIAMLKGRVLHAAVGFFLFPFSLYAACRIGKPTSWWAKRFYGERNPRKQAKAEERFPPIGAPSGSRRRVRDAIGGSPEEVYLAKIERHERLRWRYGRRARLRSWKKAITTASA